MTLQRLGSERIAVLKGFESGSPLPFRLMLRGYHRVQVETYLRKLAALQDTAEGDAEIERPGFLVTLRGYDRTQVDEFLAPLFQ